jgi:hypothetical protein
MACFEQGDTGAQANAVALTHGWNQGDEAGFVNRLIAQGYPPILARDMNAAQVATENLSVDIAIDRTAGVETSQKTFPAIIATTDTDVDQVRACLTNQRDSDPDIQQARTKLKPREAEVRAAMDELGALAREIQTYSKMPESDAQGRDDVLKVIDSKDHDVAELVRKGDLVEAQAKSISLPSIDRVLALLSTDDSVKQQQLLKLLDGDNHVVAQHLSKALEYDAALNKDPAFRQAHMKWMNLDNQIMKSGTAASVVRMTLANSWDRAGEKAMAQVLAGQAKQLEIAINNDNVRDMTFENWK